MHLSSHFCRLPCFSPSSFLLCIMAGACPTEPAVEAAAVVIDISQLPTGTMLGNYKVLAPLGSGGFGTVYRCLNKDGNAVAVKVNPILHSEKAYEAFVDKVQQKRLPGQSSDALVNEWHVLQKLAACGAQPTGYCTFPMLYEAGARLSRAVALATRLHFGAQLQPGSAPIGPVALAFTFVHCAQSRLRSLLLCFL